MRLGTPSWRASIRIARRDALRRGSRGRTALIAAMIGLPVAVVSASSVLISTGSLSQEETLDARLGASVARIVPVSLQPVIQDAYAENAQPNPSTWVDTSEADALNVGPETQETVAARWSADAVQALTGGRVIPQRAGEVVVSVDAGLAHATARETDLRDPVVAPSVRLIDGRMPATTDEVAIRPSLRDRGPDLGEVLHVGKERRPFTVVGLLSSWDPVDVYALPGSLHDQFIEADNTTRYFGPATSYLIDRTKPMPWAEVLALNRVGLAALSREVVSAPPSMSDLDPDMAELLTYDNSWDTRATVIIVVTALVIEVTLLAGPAFAVGVRRQRRLLALLGANGATPRQVGRVVKAQALVIGLGSGGVGALLGVLAAAGFVLIVQRSDPFAIGGPLDVVGWQVAACVVLAGGAALVAAWFPARQAARTDVVLELAGRRASVARSWGHPVIAAVIIAAGIAIAKLSETDDELWAVRASIATIVLVVGGIVALPTLLALASRLSRPLPLTVRLAARDVDRHRARSTPAAAAIMATVAALTTLGIAAFSDLAESKSIYLPAIASGATRIQGLALADQAVVKQVRQRTGEVVPGATVSLGGQLAFHSGDVAEVFVPTPGCPEVEASPTTICAYGWQTPDASADGLPVHDPGAPGAYLFNSEASNVGEPDALVKAGWPLTDEQRAMLESGGVLVPRADSIDADGMVSFTVFGWIPTEDGVGESKRVTVRARGAVGPLMVSGHNTTGPGVMLTPRTAVTLGLGWDPSRAMVMAQALDADQEESLDEALASVSDELNVYTEHGYDRSEGLFLLLILGGAGGLLVLIGTFTATGLAMADARPDLATLSAVGASPALRRAYSAAQALVIAFLGATLGVVLGIAPGLATTRPLTAARPGGPPFVDIPWLLLLTLVVGIPVFAALVAAMFTRSKLPVVRRLAQ